MNLNMCQHLDTTDVVSSGTVSPTASSTVLPVKPTASVETAGELVYVHSASCIKYNRRPEGIVQ